MDIKNHLKKYRILLFINNKTFHLRYNPPNPRILRFLPCLECVGFTQISLSASTIGIYSPVAQYLSGIYAMCTQRMLKKFVLWLAIIQFLLALFKLFIFFHQQQLQSRYHIHLAWIYFHLKSDKSSFNSNYVQQAHVGYDIVTDWSSVLPFCPNRTEKVN